MEINGLCDLGYKGDKFTWCNEHLGDHFTKERLDRFVAKNSWTEVFQEVWVEVLPARSSDHKPLVLNKHTIHTRCEDRRKLFIFGACWIKDKDCEEVVSKEWVNVSGSSDLMEKIQSSLRECGAALTGWSRQNSKDNEGELRSKTNRLKELEEEEKG
ncbi:uncharacterized protein LOC121247292 [Juglans microcarpa x Juglans regia]|uniref:uncharacterized protein LOC121247292 n=1 Tax=Juglans microcarpa x Juglans regia TaxID=2249226 RepID=UPI001B7DADEC|nr:uncharacterized protein LOC121247292 [Juglans microcarpa x Juglans regia]